MKTNSKIHWLCLGNFSGIKMLKRNSFILIILVMSNFFFTDCVKLEFDEVPLSELTNQERMQQLKISDPSIWNTLSTQSINIDELEVFDILKSAQKIQEYPKGGNYYFVLFEDLYPSEGDYDFNDVVLRSKLGMEKKGNTISGYFNTSLMNKGGSLPTMVGLMFYEVSGKKYKRIDFDKITVNGEKLSSKPWKANLSELGTEWTINFEFENQSADVWVSYFIETKNEIMTGGFAPSSVSEFEIPKSDFLTKRNLPWGLQIEADNFAIPNEKELFLNAYPEFQEWAESGGVKNKKWYESPNSKHTHK